MASSDSAAAAAPAAGAAAMAVGDDEEEYPPTIANLVEQESLKWIFVGGKGGVGKTTTSCSVAIQMAKKRRSVLLISTDPAHNLSDAFNQKFNKTPQLVNGFDNLYCMEIDPQLGLEQESAASQFLGEQGSEFFREMAGAIPGIDEASSFAAVMRLVRGMPYDVTVFDTAPTGHTLRLLQMPDNLTKGLEKISRLKERFGGLFEQLTGMLGLGDLGELDISAKLEETKKTIAEVSEQFKDPERTTFVCVCIAEFLSLYETERLIQELTKLNLDTHNIVVNQLLPKKTDCELCQARLKMQDKYLQQMEDLYEDFHLIKMPLRPFEIRGADLLKEFSENLMHPVDFSA